jgi:hypothetical protein
VLLLTASGHRRAKRLAALVLTLAATSCSGHGTHQAKASSTPASESPTPSPTATVTATVQRFGGWEPEFGAYVFKIAWTIDPSGKINGTLDFQQATRHGFDRRKIAVSGKASPARPGHARRHVEVTLVPHLEDIDRMSGYVDPVHVLLNPPDYASSEDTLYGSAVSVDSQFRSHKRILGGRGGYQGWLRRRGTAETAVRHTDVDGDGKRDLVAVVWADLRKPGAGGGTREVFVHFATGATAALRVSSGNTSFDRPSIGFAGIVHLAGLPGHQVVLVTDIGAANTFYIVVADVDGALREIPSPSLHQWGFGGTVGTGTEGEFCRSGAFAMYSVKYLDANTQRLTVNKYAWNGSGWSLLSHVVTKPGPGQFDEATRARGHGLWGCG